MPDLSERLNALALTLAPEGRQDLSTDVTAFAHRLSSAVSIDWKSGGVAFDESSIRAAAEDFQKSTSYAVGHAFADNLIVNLRDGFAVLDGGRHDIIPWRALNDPFVVEHLSPTRLSALGITLDDSTLVLSELASRFPTVPKCINTITVNILVDTFRDKQSAYRASKNGASLAALLPQRQPDTGGGSGGGGGGGGGQSLNILELIDRFISEDLAIATPTETSWTIGFGLCLSERGARRLVSILRFGGGAALANAADSAATDGVLSGAIIAAIAYIGGWVALIIAACMIVFSGWLEAVITTNGACIHFPWWAGFGAIPFGR